MGQAKKKSAKKSMSDFAGTFLRKKIASIAMGMLAAQMPRVPLKMAIRYVAPIASHQSHGRLLFDFSKKKDGMASNRKMGNVCESVKRENTRSER